SRHGDRRRVRSERQSNRLYGWPVRPAHRCERFGSLRPCGVTMTLKKNCRASETLRKAKRVYTQSGQALVEFAIVLPVLLILALGIIEIGRYAYISILVGNAARAGAAYGSQSRTLSGDTTGIAAAANADFAGVSTATDKNNGLLASTLT